MKLNLCSALKSTAALKVGLLCLFCCSVTSVQAAASDLLERGIYQEETKGDLTAASKVYQELLDDPTTPANFRLQAQLRFGMCQLQLGNRASAAAALEKLTEFYPDKDKLLAAMDRQTPPLLDEIIRQVEKNYIEEVSGSALLDVAIKAVLGKLDKQSDLLGEDELAQIKNQTQQKIAGIGAALKLDKETGGLLVDTPLPNSPALAAGIKAEDQIIRIDDRLVQDLPKAKLLENAVKLIQGPPGEPVSLEIKRGGASDPLQFHIVRGAINLATVLGHSYNPDSSWNFMLDNEAKVGYIRLTYVARNSPREMQAALSALLREGMKALVLDLRNNPGGLLDEAVTVSDLFLESGTILTVKSRAPEPRVYAAKSEGTIGPFRMCVLVNAKTASAAEIIAGSLQDNGRATLVGERTFGQGLVKSLLTLSGGKSALKIPTAAWYRPSGKPIHRFPDLKDSDEWGIMPDHIIQLTDEETELYLKDRKQRDTLNGSAGGIPGVHDRQLEAAVAYLTSQ